MDTRSALLELTDALGPCEVLALDTEFIRERTYYPQPCLIQVASSHVVACIDLMAIADLEPLFAMIYDETITKVLHAARQDFEIFFQLTGRLPTPIFDTQVAAGLLGHPPQVAYAQLTMAILNQTVDKSQARTDWAQRPLTEEQLHYASDDVRHLVALHRPLRAQLMAKGRLAWLEEDVLRLCDATRYRPDPTQAWRRVKGGGRLDAAGSVALKHLAAWREQRAMEEDKPRQWILTDASLIKLAQARPTSERQLSASESLSRRAMRRYAEDLLELIADMPAPVESAIAHTPPGRLSPAERELLDRLLAVVRKTAEACDVHAEILATRGELRALVRGNYDVPVLSGWRRELIGERLMSLAVETRSSGALG